MNPIKRFLKNPHAREWAGLLLLLGVAVNSVMMNFDGRFFLTSITSYDAAPFDGTVMPIQKVPDWVNLTSEEWNTTYSKLSSSKFISTPEYRNDYLTYSSDKLQSTSKDKLIRNTKITYPTPYAGNYELNDCGEGCGSHPAVDIKTLKDTPIHAIANGMVSDAGTSSSWGNYVVIEHRNVPDPNNSKGSTTLYSSYSHMDAIYVASGDAVEKNEVIGEVGDTGTATTYHLHFQIDSASAPWHPYWPFTSAEASAAGYNFWDAVNYGVGKDNLYKYTENPMDFVQDNFDSSGGSTEDDEQDDEDEDEEKNEDEAPEEEMNEEPTLNFENIRIETPYTIQAGENTELSVTMLDVNGDVMKDGTFDGKMKLSVSNEDLGKLSRDSLTASDFKKGVTSLDFYADHSGEISITATVDGFTYTSSIVNIVDSVEPFLEFGIGHDGSFVPGKAETIQIQTLDSAGRITTDFNGGGAVKLSIINGSGTITPSSLTSEDLTTGIAQVTLIAEGTKNVLIRATYGINVVQSESMQSRLFNDLDPDNNYYPAVSYLFKKGTVQGYPDGNFQPDQQVSRVEALKFIYSGLDQTTKSGLSVHFKDTYASEWYYTYLASAYSKGIVQGYPDGRFKPSQGVNRVEFLKMLFATMEFSVDPVLADDPYKDVNNLSWYAPYVAVAKEMNLFPVSGKNFYPERAMSRLEVAEVIYRTLTVRDNAGKSYSVLLKPGRD